MLMLTAARLQGGSARGFLGTQDSQSKLPRFVELLRFKVRTAWFVHAPTAAERLFMLALQLPAAWSAAQFSCQFSGRCRH